MQRNTWQKLAPLALIVLLAGCGGNSKDNKFSTLPTKNQFNKTDAELALRNALPPTGFLNWEVEQAIAHLSEVVEEKKWNQVQESITYAQAVLERNRAGIIAQAPAKNQAITGQAIDQVKTAIQAVAPSIDKQQIALGLQESGKARWLFDMVLLQVLGDYDPKVPTQWQNRPLLKGGWVIAQMDTTAGKINILMDGFNAPVTTGNFINLIQKGAYNGWTITRAEKNFVVQAGNPKAALKIPAIPLELRPAQASRAITQTPIIRREVEEVMDQGLSDPAVLQLKLKKIYDEYGAKDVEAPLIYNQVPPKGTALALPFIPPATLAMTRKANQPESGASEFFFSFADKELSPPGSNIEDGNYGVVGYMISGLKPLRDLRVGDTIKQVKLLNCAEAQFTTVDLVDYTATTLNLNKFVVGDLETICLPVGAPRLINMK